MDRKRRTDRYQKPISVPPTPYKPQRDEPVNYSYKIQGYCPLEANEVIQPKRRRNAVYIIAITVLSAVFIFAAVQLIVYLVHSHQAKQEEQLIQALIAQSEAQQVVTDVPAASQTATPEPAATASPTPRVYTSIQTVADPEVLIQFTKALSLNPDTVGQLDMGESISAYVVQRDNSYYLRHSFLGEYSFSGAIFLDVSCSIYPQSRNLIIHGHNMQDGTAFGKLSRFEDIDYLNEYPFIEFSTLYESALYIPFAVVYYSIDPDSEEYLDIYQINSMSNQEFVRFVSKVQLMSEYHIPVNVSGTDKILTVTTCTSGDEDMRFAVFAVKYVT